MKVTYADGSEEIKKASAFRRKPKVSNGLCRDCGAKVRWVRKGRKHVLLDRGGYTGQVHDCRHYKTDTNPARPFH